MLPKVFLTKSFTIGWNPSLLSRTVITSMIGLAGNVTFANSHISSLP